jgi:hypothetical protein
MSTNDRQSLFEQAKLMEKKRLADQESKKGLGGNFEYEDMCYTGLEFDKFKIVRLLGHPKINREDAYSPKDVNVSMIVGDNDKKFRCIWPLKEEMPNWILWKVYNKVMSYKWDKTLNGGKGGPVYDNSDLHPAIFKRIAKNNIDKKEENGWKPSKHVVFNVIDRQDMDWHRVNKHTKLLSKKIGLDKDGNPSYPETGIPETLYTKGIWNEVVEYNGNWEEYDIALAKVKTGPNTSDVSYKAYHCEKELNKIPQEYHSFIKEGLLTEEEKSWERYNIDKLFKVTSYQKIKRNLGIFIQSVDATFGTKFSEELDQLAEEEKKKFEENKDVQKDPVFKAQDTNINVAKKQDPAPARPAARELKKEVVEFNINSLDPNIYKGISKLSDDEKKYIIGCAPDGSLDYTKDSGQIYSCKECDFVSPEKLHCCPKCSVEF